MIGGMGPGAAAALPALTAALEVETDDKVMESLRSAIDSLSEE